MVLLTGLADDETAGFPHVINTANAAQEGIVADGAITRVDRSGMAVGNYPRRKRDLVAPFAANGRFQQLTVEDCEMSEFPDGAWTDYQRDGNKEALVTKHVLFFRSILVPSLASALVRVRAGDTEAIRAFGNQLEQLLKRRLLRQPAATHSFVQTIVLAKAKQD